MRYFIIDALNLAYRAHNANIELKTSDGNLSGMLFGFTRTIYSLKKKYRGYKFVVVWDNRPAAKFEIQPDYKAGRISLGSNVLYQIDYIKEFLKSAGVDQYNKIDEEADDVIATLVEQFKKEAENIVIYSNDKDLLQLVETGKVIVYKPKVSMSPEKFYDENAVIDQFGVPPSRLALYRSFDGDSSDNIRGVERVPRKIIAKIVNSSNTVEEFYGILNLENITDFQKKSFEEARERVTLNAKIVTLKKNLDNIINIPGILDKNNISDIFNKFQIRSIDPGVFMDLFSSSLNIRYSDSRPTLKIESYSLFN